MQLILTSPINSARFIILNILLKARDRRYPAPCINVAPCNASSKSAHRTYFMTIAIPLFKIIPYGAERLINLSILNRLDGNQGAFR
jgi:hypothetical protein